MYGESQCPRCDAQLWHLVPPSRATFFVRRKGESIYDLMAAVLGARLGLTAKDMENVLKEADSLDVVELLMDLEDALRV